jgi:hypothetical protein
LKISRIDMYLGGRIQDHVTAPSKQMLFVGRKAIRIFSPTNC